MITKNSNLGKNVVRTLLIILGVIIAIFLSLQSDLIASDSNLDNLFPKGKNVASQSEEKSDGTIQLGTFLDSEAISKVTSQFVQKISK